MEHLYIYILLSSCFSLQDIMKSRDVDENGCLSFDEFLKAMPANTHISEEEHL